MSGLTGFQVPRFVEELAPHERTPPRTESPIKAPLSTGRSSFSRRRRDGHLLLLSRRGARLVGLPRRNDQLRPAHPRIDLDCRRPGTRAEPASGTSAPGVYRSDVT